MINAFRINESVANEMSRIGVRGKPVVEAEGEKPKRIDVKVTTKSDSWVTGFNGTLEEAKKYFMGRKFETKDEKPGDPVTSVTLVSGVKESQRGDRKLITESDEVDDKKPAADATHDEAAEEKEDPTREKLETPEDEKDEKKGGPAELAADLRVSVRIEKMNVGRYKRMITKHTLSADDEKWLKGRIEQIEGEIKIMSDKIPELEKEAEGQKTEMKEMFIAGIKKAIVEMAAG